MIVIDASIAIKWFHEEKDTLFAEKIRDELINEEIAAVIPNLLFYEAANVLACKARRDIRSIMMEAIEILFTLP